MDQRKNKVYSILSWKLTDLYSDNKPIRQNIDQKISVSWTDTPDLVDLDAALVDDIKDPEPKSSSTGS